MKWEVIFYAVELTNFGNPTPFLLIIGFIIGKGNAFRALRKIAISINFSSFLIVIYDVQIKWNWMIKCRLSKQIIALLVIIFLCGSFFQLQERRIKWA